MNILLLHPEVLGFQVCIAIPGFQSWLSRILLGSPCSIKGVLVCLSLTWSILRTEGLWGEMCDCFLPLVAVDQSPSESSSERKSCWTIPESRPQR